MSDYLGLLDGMVRAGLDGLGPRFHDAQLARVLPMQHSDGAFPAPGGSPDLYYTDFGVRLLALLDAPTAAFTDVAAYLASLPCPRDLVEVFSLLNCRRVMEPRGVSSPLDQAGLLAVIESQRSAPGGYGRSTDGAATAYATFLAGLCLAMLEQPIPDQAEAVAAVAGLQRPDGGFALDAEGSSQTNATAAALAFVIQEDSLTDTPRQRAVAFLVSQQCGDGGFRAHPTAPAADLLSTFTALCSLIFAGDPRACDLVALAGFVRRCADGRGGFAAAPGSAEVDIEYLFYGLATLALLQWIVQVSEA